MEDIPYLDVIVFQRQGHPFVLEIINYANSLGKTTVFELDDDLWSISPTNPGYKFWQEPGRKQGIEECMRACKVVTTTTPWMADLLSRYNKDVKILPNMLPGVLWRVKKPKCKDGKLIIGWSGSKHHWDDLALLSGTIQQLLDEYENIEFHLAGPEVIPLEPHKRAFAIPAVQIQDYARLVKTFDIGLAPITDTRFNKCKSDLKFIEYGMVGLAVVASKVEPYIHSIKHGENGVLVQNTKDWLKWLRRIIEDKELRDQLGKNAKEYAKTRTIEKNIWMWEDAYGIGESS